MKDMNRKPSDETRPETCWHVFRFYAKLVRPPTRSHGWNTQQHWGCLLLVTPWREIMLNNYYYSIQKHTIVLAALKYFHDFSLQTTRASYCFCQYIVWLSWQHHWQQMRLRRVGWSWLKAGWVEPSGLIARLEGGRKQSRTGHLYCCWPLAEQWNIAQLWLLLRQNTDVSHDFTVIKGFARHLKTSSDRNEMIKQTICGDCKEGWRLFLTGTH